jgi:hypothetical protein
MLPFVSTHNDVRFLNVLPGNPLLLAFTHQLQSFLIALSYIRVLELIRSSAQPLLSNENNNSQLHKILHLHLFPHHKNCVISGYNYCCVNSVHTILCS